LSKGRGGGETGKKRGREVYGKREQGGGNRATGGTGKKRGGSVLEERKGGRE